MKYNFREIEPKWQEKWAEEQTYTAENQSDKPKYYVLDMFPYPSGAGLHVGHPVGYIASDIVSRYMRHCDYNVLHPMGYDSFGLPAEQYAIQTGQHPAITTEKNIKRYRKQLYKIGLSFDRSREICTSSPDFYSWTQWIFIQLFNSWYNKRTDKAEPIAELKAKFNYFGTEGIQAAFGKEMSFTAKEWAAFSKAEKEAVLQNYRLTYRSESMVNWCPELGVLANDEVKDGRSKRGDYSVIQKKMMQWSMRITAYAQRLLDGLEEIDWPESIKESQRNWIGRSEGVSIFFSLKNHEEKIEIFTIRPDTIFGVTFIVLAPEHKLIDKITTADQKGTVERYKKQARRKNERDRISGSIKTLTGDFTGTYAIHPFSGNLIPIWIGDYVLVSYGAGAVAGVAAHDSRDYAFAKKFELLILKVVSGGNIEDAYHDAKEGTLINSDFLNGLEVKDAIAKAIEEIEKRGLGKATVTYRLRDVVFGRQRYWGEAIPIYFEEGIPKTIKEEHLPLKLPQVDTYLPTEEGEPPLARAKKWNYHPEKGVVPKDGGFPLEAATMPGWAGSSWYYLRYMDSNNANEFVGKRAEQYWQNVDLYVGGSEHATGHLLYSRFWHKFIQDQGKVHTSEPFKKLINQGMITGESAFIHRVVSTNSFVSAGLKKDYKTSKLHVDVSMVSATDELDMGAFKSWRKDFADAEFITEKGKFFTTREVEKMSKSKFNVVNPDDVIEQYGADTLRMYEMFLGPLEQSKPWHTTGISGVHNFLKKLWCLYHQDRKWNILEENPDKKELKSLHTLIKKVNKDIQNFSFNTSISAFMICVNELRNLKCNKRKVLEPLTVLISPFAPHIAEELWLGLGHKDSVTTQAYPEHKGEYLVENSFDYPVSFNGKLRFRYELPLSLSKKEIEEEVLLLEKTQHYLQGKNPKKIIVVPGKIINIAL